MTSNRSGMDQEWTWTGSGPELDNNKDRKCNNNCPNEAKMI